MNKTFRSKHHILFTNMLCLPTLMVSSQDKKYIYKVSHKQWMNAMSIPFSIDVFLHAKHIQMERRLTYMNIMNPTRIPMGAFGRKWIRKYYTGIYTCKTPIIYRLKKEKKKMTTDTQMACCKDHFPSRVVCRHSNTRIDVICLNWLSFLFSCLRDSCVSLITRSSTQVRKKPCLHLFHGGLEEFFTVNLCLVFVFNLFMGCLKW